MSPMTYKRLVALVIVGSILIGVAGVLNIAFPTILHKPAIKCADDPPCVTETELADALHAQRHALLRAVHGQVPGQNSGQNPAPGGGGGPGTGSTPGGLGGGHAPPSQPHEPRPRRPHRPRHHRPERPDCTVQVNRLACLRVHPPVKPPRVPPLP